MLLSNLNLLATAPGGVPRLRELILTLAVQGKLVPQAPKDEPARELLKKIRTEKDRLIAESKIKRDKPLAEIAEDEKPYALPAPWEWARLGALTSKLTDGSHNPPPDSGAGYPMLSSQNVWEGGLIDFRAPTRYVSESDFAIENRRTTAAPGDVLLTIVASLGRSAVVPINAPAFVLQRSVAIIRTSLDPAYLSLFLRSPIARAFYDLHGKGTAQKGIYLGKLGTMPIPVPPIAEQFRIVTRVEELMRLCDALEAKGQLEATRHAQLVSTLLDTLTDSETPEQLAENWRRIASHFDLLLDRPEAVDALEQTILQLAVRGLLVPQDPQDEPAIELLARVQHARAAKRKIVRPDDEILNTGPQVLPSGWTWASVDQVSADSDTAITDGPFGANLKTEHYVGASGFRVVRLQNIGEGTFRKEHHAYIDQARFELLSKHRIFAGDIVVAGLVDESIRCCIVPSEIGPAIVKADCYRFSVHKSLNTEYICLYLSSNFAHEFASVHHHGLTLTRIGLGNFRSIPVPIPPAAEQSRIVTRVASLRRLCADLRQRLATSQSTQAHLAEALIQEVA